MKRQRWCVQFKKVRTWPAKFAASPSIWEELRCTCQWVQVCLAHLHICSTKFVVEGACKSFECLAPNLFRPRFSWWFEAFAIALHCKVQCPCLWDRPWRRNNGGRWCTIPFVCLTHVFQSLKIQTALLALRNLATLWHFNLTRFSFELWERGSREREFLSGFS